MATKTVVCPECGSPAAPGRYACAECGALLASVALMPRSLTSIDATPAGSTVDGPPPDAGAGAEPDAAPPAPVEPAEPEGFADPAPASALPE
jgi:DNA-directed RNA polymerase subunit RPC12/RpoP